ncbi:MAG: PKD domain-containing protein [Bacteroidales bacterium]|nr:PKD domain-containing protein [Bacteroidales bacterium]MDD3859719.1 PKD domain-containing protein [Bacteroidales bacterium]
MKTILIIIFVFTFAISTKAQEWSYNFVGLDSIWDPYVYDLYNDGDSVLYIGGGFYYVNDQLSVGIASWHGDHIRTYDEGIDWGIVKCVTIYKDTLYIGGSFNGVSGNSNLVRLAAWNGNSWQMAKIGKPGEAVFDLKTIRDTLYLCGNFETISGSPYHKIAAYFNGHGINIGFMGMWTQAIETLNGELYAGGYWGLRRYLGNGEWETMEYIIDGVVYDLEVDTINSFLYFGGEFTEAVGEISMGVAMWDGFKINPMGDLHNWLTWYKGLQMYHGDIYVGNGIVYHEAEGTYETFINKWNGESWDSIGGNFNNSIMALEHFRDTLIIGGLFSTSNNQRATGIAKLYMPDNGCHYLKPRINTYADTFYLNGGEVDVNLYNNNPYVDSWEWDFDDGGVSTSSTTAVEHTYTEAGEYNVQVTVTDGECVKTANKTIYIELGNELPQYEKIDMQVHPNPSSNDFTVKVTLPNYNNAEIKIAGLNGHLKSVIPVTSETTIIPTKGWKAGVYVCNLFVEGKLVKVEKLVFE